jgi:hypothetical protein
MDIQLDFQKLLRRDNFLLQYKQPSKPLGKDLISHPPKGRRSK